MSDKDLITEVNVTELLKIAKQSEHQYNAVVKQNKELQAELREVQNENFLLKDAFETYKKENDELKQYKEVVDKLAGMQVILTNEEKMPMLYENAKDLKLKQLSQTLTEIKEIAENAYCLTNATNKDMAQFAKQVLQKISEVVECG